MLARPCTTATALLSLIPFFTHCVHSSISVNVILIRCNIILCYITSNLFFFLDIKEASSDIKIRKFCLHELKTSWMKHESQHVSVMTEQKPHKSKASGFSRELRLIGFPLTELSYIPNDSVVIGFWLWHKWIHLQALIRLQGHRETFTVEWTSCSMCWEGSARSKLY